MTAEIASATRRVKCINQDNDGHIVSGNKTVHISRQVHYCRGKTQKPSTTKLVQLRIELRSVKSAPQRCYQFLQNIGTPHRRIYFQNIEGNLEWLFELYNNRSIIIRLITQITKEDDTSCLKKTQRLVKHNLQITLEVALTYWVAHQPLKSFDRPLMKVSLSDSILGTLTIY